MTSTVVTNLSSLLTCWSPVYKTHQLCTLQALIAVDPDMVHRHVIEWIGQLAAAPGEHSAAKWHALLQVVCTCSCTLGAGDGP